ncbi:hypothetical protein OPQ81_002889 [Rhizoctonia solani]|nr:hypothetical protein OPQ81_002889 [Rhizoctonia solani]
MNATLTNQRSCRESKELAASRSKGSLTAPKGFTLSKAGLDEEHRASISDVYESQLTGFDRPELNAKVAQRTKKEQDVSDQRTRGLAVSLFGRDLNARHSPPSGCAPLSQSDIRPGTSSASPRSDCGVYTPPYARKKRKDKERSEQRVTPDFYTPLYAEEGWVDVAQLEIEASESKNGKGKQGENKILSKLRRFAFAASHETRAAEKRYKGFDKWSNQCEDRLEEEVRMDPSDELMQSILGDIYGTLSEANLRPGDYGLC